MEEFFKLCVGRLFQSAIYGDENRTILPSSFEDGILVCKVVTRDGRHITKRYVADMNFYKYMRRLTTNKPIQP